MSHILERIIGVREKNNKPKDRERIGIICPKVNDVWRINCEKRPSNTPLKKGVPIFIHSQSWLPQIKKKKNGK